MTHDDPADGRTRRRMLAAGAAALLGVTAGCADLRHRLAGDGDPADAQSYDRLPDMAVYVADGVDLSVPPAVGTVDGTSDADLLLLADDTDVGAARAADWLVDDRDVALYGDAAEATWLEWAGSDAYDDAFANGGVADGDPDPQLIVGTAAGDRVTTDRTTWGNPPDDEAVFLAIDEAVADLSRAD